MMIIAEMCSFRNSRLFEWVAITRLDMILLVRQLRKILRSNICALNYPLHRLSGRFLLAYDIYHISNRLFLGNGVPCTPNNPTICTGRNPFCSQDSDRSFKCCSDVIQARWTSSFFENIELYRIRPKSPNWKQKKWNRSVRLGLFPIRCRWWCFAILR